MLAGLLWNKWSFLILFSIIHFGCWWEYLKLIKKIHRVNFHPYLEMGLMVIGYGLMLRFCGPGYHLDRYGIQQNLSLPVSAAGFALVILGIFQKNVLTLASLGAAAIGWIYISLSWGWMLSFFKPSEIPLHNNTYVLQKEFTIPVMIIASIWVNDTMAYIVGSLIGKTPLSKISPKKTWEGTMGGILLCIAVIGLVAPLVFINHFDWAFAIFSATIAGIAAVTGTLGDLLESKLKRMAGVKDSGRIMPGHGGFLDRFDSLLIAIPCVGVYLLSVVR